MRECLNIQPDTLIDEQERTHTSAKFEGGLGLALGGGLSLEVKTDHRTYETSFTACLSESETIGEAYGALTYNKDASGEVVDTMKVSSGWSVTGFVGGGVLAGKLEYDVLADKTEYTYGLKESSGIVGIGLRSDVAFEGCLEINPAGVFRAIQEFLEHRDQKDVFVTGKTNSEPNNAEPNHPLTVRGSQVDRSKSDMGTLSKRPVDSSLNRFSGV